MRAWIPITMLFAVGCSRDLALPDRAVPVSFSPAFLSAAPWEAVDLTVSGGRAPFRYAFAEGGQNSGLAAAIDADTGRYTAGHDGPAIDFVEVTDAAGTRATVRIAVGAPFTLSPTTAFVAPGGTVPLVPMGGKAPYVITLEPGSPGAVLGGSYVAPEQPDCMALSAPPDTATLTVKDDTAAPAITVTVSIGRGLDVFPASGDSAVAPAERLTLVASGGQPPYEFSMVTNGSSSPGIDAGRGTYAAGAVGDTTDTLAVTDANGQVRCIDVGVGPALAATLSTAEVRPNVPLRILATGGRPPYAFAFAAKGNRSRAVLDPITGDYAPGPNAGTTDLVYVRDATEAPPFGPIAIDVGQLVLPTGNASVCFTADLSGDGRADYVGLSRQAPYELSTAISRSGAEPLVTTYPLATAGFGIAAADLNGTGHASVALLTAYELRFLLADLDGHLTLGPQGLDFGATPSTATRLLAAGSGLVNGVTTHRFAVSIPSPASGLTIVDWPDGAQAPSATPTDVLTASSVSVVELLDWNGDGVLDIVYVASIQQQVLRLLAGNADGTFGPETAIPLADPTYRMATGGINTIHRLRRAGATADDLLVLATAANNVDKAFFALPALATVTTGPWRATVDGIWAPVGFAVFSPVAGAEPEVVAFTRYSNSVALYPYPFDVSPLVGLPFAPRAFGPRCAAAGDVDGDAIPDLLLSSTQAQTEVLLGDSDGLFGRRRHFYSGTGAIIVADMDADLAADVVVSSTALALEVQFGTEGQLAVSEPTPTGASERILRAVDLDGEGPRDLFFVTVDGALLRFDADPAGDGRFGAAKSIELRTSTGLIDAGYYLSWRPAELGGAAHGPDWLVHSIGTTPTTLAAVVRPDGLHAVSYPLPAIPGVSLASEINPDTRSALFAADLDGDGDSDAVISGYPNFGPVQWSRAGGGGANPWEFGPWTPVGTGVIAAGAGETLYAIPIGIGVLPTGVGAKQRALIGARINTPAGSFPFLVNVTESGVARVQLADVTWQPWFGEFGDLDGDGRTDLAIQDTSYWVHVYLDDGSGWSAAPVEALSFQGPGKLAGLLAVPGGRGNLLFRTPDALVVVSNAELFPPP